MSVTCENIGLELEGDDEWSGEKTKKSHMNMAKAIVQVLSSENVSHALQTRY